MSDVILFVVGWVGAGLFLYHAARLSWNRRWKDDSAPFNYWFAAFLGPACLGFTLCELLFSATWENE